MTLLDRAPGNSKLATPVSPHIFRITTGISNAYFVTLPTGEYVLIDAGGTGYGKKIFQAALDLFGSAPPAAVLLTHAHFDHAGGLPELLQFWPDIPIFAHALELPYINNGVRYPPGDPTVGGLMAELSRTMDTSRPTPLPTAAQPFPEESAELDFMPGWEIRPSPGHTPGHVSFWHEADRILISGDAIVTMDSDFPAHMLMNRPKLSSPPPYATYNWHHARQSARALAELEPVAIFPGHGPPDQGEHLPFALHHFAAEFPTPKRGRYVHSPARFNREGPTFIPPPAPDYVKYSVLTASALLLGAAIYAFARPRKSSAWQRMS